MSDGRVRYAVEIESLADFGAFVDREMATALEPGSTVVRDSLPRGQQWGSTLHTNVVKAARLGYLHAHGRAGTNLDGYLDAGAAMLEVIKRLMETYSTSEAFAALQVEDVLRLFHDVALERHRAAGSSPVFA